MFLFDAEAENPSVSGTLTELYSNRIVIERDNELEDDLAAYVEAKIEERKAAKKARDFAKADAIRDELKEKGIILEDTREGVKWKKV